jgi:hypothetical protein
MYSTIPKSKEWLTINCVVDVIGTSLPRFYIFKRKKIHDDYIQLCKLGTCMAMQSKAWMTTFLFKEFLFYFKSSIPGGISISNKHLLILDGHGSHVILETIEQASEFGLDMATLLLHTCHALQPLDVVCFKSFKINFKREKNTTMVTRN